MKIISKLIYKELLPTTLIAAVVMTFMAFTKEFQRFAELLITSGSSLSAFMTVIITICANVLYVILPISILVGIVSGFSRLSADNELIALKSGGVGLWQLLTPVLVVAIIGTGITFFLSTIGAPTLNAHLRNIQYEVAISQITTEIQPRTFNEKFKNFVFYVEDTDQSTNTWKGIFLADQRDVNSQRIYLARSGRVFFQRRAKYLQLHLKDGVIYSFTKNKPLADSLTYFGSMDIPLSELNVTPPEQTNKRNVEKSLAELSAEIHSRQFPEGSDPQNSIEIEYYRRFAIPFACIVFGIIGLPLGMQARRSGRMYGFLLSILVVVLYYLTFLYSWKIGFYSGLIPIRCGVWIANILFAGVGLFMLLETRRERHPFSLLANRPYVSKGIAIIEIINQYWIDKTNNFKQKTKLDQIASSERPFRFTRVLDVYILREYLKIMGLIIASFIFLFIIFTLFENFDEIITHHIPWTTVIEYFLFISPMIIVLSMPICLLLALLISFGILEKTFQITAFKSCGISLYRIVQPVIFLAVITAVGIFGLQEYIMPYTNQRQDLIYNMMKGRTPQTYRPDITWIMGSDGKIYNYRYFDTEEDVFADLSVYNLQLDQARLHYRYFAPRAIWDGRIRKWILINGWERNFHPESPYFRVFDSLARDFAEQPAYFKTEAKKSNKMSIVELSRYIDKLKQGGFNTLGLEVDLYAKFSYPMINFIMLLIGIPFSFKMGKRGALYGVAISILIGIAYWALFNVFTAMGAYGKLPPLLAAWAPNLFFGFAGIYMFLNVRT